MPDTASVQTEQVKYKKLWERPEYRVYAPGEHLVLQFLETVRPHWGATIFDIGAGTGRAAVKLQRLGFDVYPVDIAENALSPEVAEELKHPLAVCDISKEDAFSQLYAPASLCGPGADYTFCTDVMEHIPTEAVDAVLENIRLVAPETYLSIAFQDDSCGALIDEPLHLTVRPYEWWLKELRKLGDVVDARDLLQQGVFHVRFV